jgi:hypothetical protein
MRGNRRELVVKSGFMLPVLISDLFAPIPFEGTAQRPFFNTCGLVCILYLSLYNSHVFQDSGNFTAF